MGLDFSFIHFQKEEKRKLIESIRFFSSNLLKAGLTPLIIAILRQCLESVKILVANRADVNTKLKEALPNDGKSVCCFHFKLFGEFFA